MNKDAEVRPKEQNWNNPFDEMRMPWEPGKDDVVGYVIRENLILACFCHLLCLMTSATLPRNTSSLIHNLHEGRPFSDFDAGINSSTAWTEHLELEASASEEGIEEEDSYRPARALYDFEGKAEFRELNVHAGDSLQVVKQELSDGWSLVKKDDGEIGLLPKDYYTVRRPCTSNSYVSDTLDTQGSLHLISPSHQTCTSVKNLTLQLPVRLLYCLRLWFRRPLEIGSSPASEEASLAERA